MRLVLTAIIVITSSQLYGQTVELPLTPVNKDYYAWITSLEESPVNWLDTPDGQVEGRALRVCITTSEIYNNLYIEEVTFGMEGCCKQIASKKQLDLYEFFIKFVLTGEVANVKLLGWLNDNTFQLTIRKSTFTLLINANSVTIERSE